MPDYEAWKESTGTKGWSIKYYKGLGTSTAKEAKEYFSTMTKHRIGFTCETEEDADSIDMAFSKKRIEDRKDWLRGYVPGSGIEYDVESMPYSE